MSGSKNLIKKPTRRLVDSIRNGMVYFKDDRRTNQIFI